jgi:hypothetical protein
MSASILECGGKRIATPLWLRARAKRDEVRKPVVLVRSNAPSALRFAGAVHDLAVTWTNS